MRKLLSSLSLGVILLSPSTVSLARGWHYWEESSSSSSSSSVSSVSSSSSSASSASSETKREVRAVGIGTYNRKTKSRLHMKSKSVVPAYRSSDTPIKGVRPSLQSRIQKSLREAQ